MGGGPVGGDPATIEAGAAALSRIVDPVRAAGNGIRRGSDVITGDAAVDAALARFSAALSGFCEDVAVQLRAAAQLAQHGSQDLAAAGDQPPASGHPVPRNVR